MLKNSCLFILKLFKWTPIVTVEIPPKCVIAVAPHTSNSDFFIAKIFYCAIGEAKPHFLMKKEWFFFPLSCVLKAIGGIPVDRKKKQSMTEQMVEIFNTKEKFQLAIAPEGTRKKTSDWKTGFYYIALKAQVPILFAHLDYTTKEIGITRIFHPTGNEEEDMLEIKNFYKKFQGKHPENFTV